MWVIKSLRTGMLICFLQGTMNWCEPGKGERTFQSFTAAFDYATHNGLKDYTVVRK